MATPEIAAPAAQPTAASAEASPEFDWKTADPARITKAFQDPAFLAQAAQSYLSRGLPEGVKWLERAHGAAKENAFEALALLEAGDGDAAIKAFNSSGKFTNATAAKNNGDGTWTLSGKDGKDLTINPANLRKTLLSPMDYFKATEEERRTGILKQNADTLERSRVDRAENDRQQNQNQDAYYRRVTDNAAERTQAQRDIAEAKAEVARAAAEGKAVAGAVSAQAKSDLAAHKAEINDKNSPLSLYTKLLESGEPDAEKNADRQLARHPRVVPVITTDGRVGIFHENQIGEDGRPTGRPYRRFESSTEYETATGLKLPKRAAPPAEKAPDKPKAESRRIAAAAPPPELGVTADDVWGKQPPRRVVPVGDESKYKDVGSY